ncbi:bifunctional folylpolyglutamate synthase/dihydrofolate synthase [Aequorivita vladivostokensis]|uniref:Dihydrofolate synthase/folylpolyglutamate synthase n=1 Tax=Aequorivita vladivostokensis TaxID=171194 RepID=A0ABR5DG89_9FLAO|nr:folylpolyglutamate synthase/dihydrofolate synthase family protein [Aequorivita vladivostokensis]KJJ37771.1 tetrahydrofolate synthase [Aequorivita vladivostokensis]MAB55961.1 bifunctional folylpolyglutamate synthase/dihydrofolate synthase [Aequorivita sp.]MBF31274.1 bifunctional folylpolyglutamate synthase/dihydrofolate synthase [Aequorivita sp.]
MNYSETIAWLFAQLPMYQRVGQSAYKADLAATLNLAKYLKNPEKSFKSIHVAGTNGKGSTSHMLASVFQEAGYKTGLYTSPHLKDFRERIKINGQMISEQYVSNFVQNHRPFFESNQLSFFEMTVGLAFEYFRSENVDIAIVEVGMGGRLDSTNIIAPEVSVITNIGLDHTQFLGDTLEKVAVEKAGIIKDRVPVIIGETSPETKRVFEEIALERNAPIVFAEMNDASTYSSDLKGSYQQKNIRTVISILRMLQKKGWNISEENIQKGLMNTVKNTGLMGRWQILGQAPKVICDTAHNREGLQIVLDQLASEDFQNLHIILGVVNDKDLASILPLFPKDAIYYFCRPNIPRGLDASLLLSRARGFGLIGQEYISVSKAYEAALKAALPQDLVFVGGSTFVVAEVL